MKKNFFKVIAMSLAVVTVIGAISVPASAARRTKRVRRRSQYTVGIDPGHQQRGNSSTEPAAPGSRTRKAKVSGGTYGRYSRIPEYKLTMAVANQLKKELTARGYKVVMTRTRNNVNISNAQRAQKLNKSCNIAVRLHADGVASSSAHGASMQCSTKRNRYVGKLFNQCNSLSQKILAAYTRSTGLKNRGIAYRDDLTGTNYSKIPVTLIEMGFMTNRSDDLYMSKAANQKKMAKGIANGIDAYFGF